MEGGGLSWAYVGRKGIFQYSGWVPRAQNMNSVPDPKSHYVLHTNLSPGRIRSRTKLRPADPTRASASPSLNLKPRVEK